jgi:hypothetical protein
MVNKAESSLLFLWRSHSSGDKQKSNDKHGKPNGGKYQKKNKADRGDPILVEINKNQMTNMVSQMEGSTRRKIKQTRRLKNGGGMWF